MQGSGGGIRGPSTAVAGSSIQVHVQDGVQSVRVSTLGDEDAVSFPVASGNTVTIPVPTEAAGSFLLVLTEGAPPPSAISVSVISLN